MIKGNIIEKIEGKIKTELSHEEAIGGRYVFEWVLSELNKMSCVSCKKGNEVIAMVRCKFLNDVMGKDFCCNKWEQK